MCVPGPQSQKTAVKIQLKEQPALITYSRDSEGEGERGREFSQIGQIGTLHKFHLLGQSTNTNVEKKVKYFLGFNSF